MNTLELVEMLKNILGIKEQTDKLQFDDNNYVISCIGNDKLGKATYPTVIDFSKEWHKYLVNWEDINAEVVDLSAEGIPTPHIRHSGKALKIPVGAGESKKAIISVPYCAFIIGIYCTGTVTAWLTGMGLSPEAHTLNSWQILGSVVQMEGGIAINVNGGSNGGNLYIGYIELLTGWQGIGTYISPYYSSHPEDSFDGTTTKDYLVYPQLERNENQLWIYVTIAGDGTNPLNVDVYIKTVDGFKLIASASRIDSTPTRMFLGSFPVKCGGENVVYTAVKFSVSGYGLFRRFEIRLTNPKKLFVHETNLNGLKTASASNTSTTATTYTLIDNNGRGNRYKNAVINISVPSTGGSAEILINGKTVATYSAGASATFNIPDDIDIWKIEVNLAGDGTNPATAEFSGLELLGPYIVRR